jgi:hypothetical protein
MRRKIEQMPPSMSILNDWDMGVQWVRIRTWFFKAHKHVQSRYQSGTIEFATVSRYGSSHLSITCR